MIKYEEKELLPDEIKGGYIYWNQQKSEYYLYEYTFHIDNNLIIEEDFQIILQYVQLRLHIECFVLDM